MAFERSLGGAVLAVLLLLPSSVTGQMRDDILRPVSPAGALTASARCDTGIVIAGDTLEATYYLPPSAPPDSLGYPAMLFVPGFGESKNGDTLSASLWAGSGYVSLCYSVRGQGKSGGRSTIMGPAERRDLDSVLRFLKRLSGVNPGRVGIQGGSQGGLHGLWAVEESLVVAATADVITPSWASDMVSNGSFRTMLVTLLQMPGVRYDPVRDTLWHFLRDEQHGDFRSVFVPGRDVVLLARSRVPLALFAKWQDHYFSVGDALEWYASASGERKLYLGTGGHYSDSIPSELSYQWSTVNRWHQEFTQGKTSGILSEPRLAVAVSSLPVQGSGTFTWTRSELETWPPEGVEPYRLFLLPDSLLMPVTVSGRADSSLLVNACPVGYTVDSAFAAGFQDLKIPEKTIRFTSRVLQDDAVLCGPARFHVAVRSPSAVFPLHARLHEVDSSGLAHLVTRVNFIARDWAAGFSGTVEAAGPAHAHRFSRGSRIRIELTNLDIETRPGWGSRPFVLPLFRHGEVAIYADSLHGSYVEFPFLGNPVLGTTVASFDARFDASAREVVVSWSTLVEADNSEFRVMKRGGGAEVQIAAVLPQGGPVSTAPLTYTFVDTAVEEGEWTYRLIQVDRFGLWQTGGEKSVTVTLNGIAREVPHVTELEQNFPNPFNPVTTIRFAISGDVRGGVVRLALYDLLGREVVVLVNEPKAPGRYEVRFNAIHFASGVYLYRLTAGTHVETRKLVLMR